MAGADTSGRVRRLAARTALGYRIAPSAERSALEVLAAAGITAGLSQLMDSQLSPSTRIVRLSGGVLMFGSVIAAFLTRNDPREPPFGIPFGIGTGISSPGRRPAVVQVFISAVGTTVVAVDLHRRGAIHEAVRQLAAG